MTSHAKRDAFSLKQRFISFSYSQYQHHRHSSDSGAMKNGMVNRSSWKRNIHKHSACRHLDSLRCHSIKNILIYGNKDRPNARFSALSSRDVSFLLLALANLALPLCKEWEKNEKSRRKEMRYSKWKINFIWFDFEFFMNESGNAEGNRKLAVRRQYVYDDDADEYPFFALRLL